VEAFGQPITFVGKWFFAKPWAAQIFAIIFIVLYALHVNYSFEGLRLSLDPWIPRLTFRWAILYWLLLSTWFISQYLWELHAIKTVKSIRRVRASEWPRSFDLDELVTAIRIRYPSGTTICLEISEPKAAMTCWRLRSNLLRYEYCKIGLLVTTLVLGLYFSLRTSVDLETLPSPTDNRIAATYLESGITVLTGCVLGALGITPFLDCGVLLCSDAHTFSKALADWKHHYYYPLLASMTLLLSFQQVQAQSTRENMSLLLLDVLLVVLFLSHWSFSRNKSNMRLFPSVCFQYMAFIAMLTSDFGEKYRLLIAPDEFSALTRQWWAGPQALFFMAFLLNMATTIAVHLKPASAARCIENHDYKGALQQLEAWRPLRPRRNPTDACNMLIQLYIENWVQERVLNKALKGGRFRIADLGNTKHVMSARSRDGEVCDSKECSIDDAVRVACAEVSAYLEAFMSKETEPDHRKNGIGAEHDFQDPTPSPVLSNTIIGHNALPSLPRKVLDKNASAFQKIRSERSQ
jgi:hypothetical protein